MSWNEVPVMSQRKEFVSLAAVDEANISALCERFRISRKTGYKWLRRFACAPEDPDWARDRSRRPHRLTGCVSEETERAVLAVRDEHPVWGSRKIRRCLEWGGWPTPPAPSTITAILRRNGRIAPEESAKRGPMQRFEREQPNELWQMDFKGRFNMMRGHCHALTVVDDHSRFAVCVAACAVDDQAHVRQALADTFRLYGLPARMLMDNGTCWKSADAPYTKLTAWLLRLGVALSHGRPRHPQTQGKNERFNRTLKAEAIRGRLYRDIEECQRAFDCFRHTYNHERPHEALQMATPVSRYRISPFAYPETLPPIEYLATDIVRHVGAAGYLSYRKNRFHVGRAFSGDPVGLRHTERDGVMDVYYCGHIVAVIDLRSGQCTQQ